jgi:hypothetical protein
MKDNCGSEHHLLFAKEMLVVRKAIFGLITILFLCASMAHAADLGVLEAEPAQTANLGDMKLNVPVDVPGFGEITITNFEWQDTFYVESGGWGESGYDTSFVSGVEAEYASLRVDILNMLTQPVDYTKEAKVTVTYNENYALSGWVYQYNLDATQSVKSKVTKAIDPYYVGHYKFGSTLPNAIVNDEKSPLKMTINIGDVEMIYNIRK